MAIFCEASTSLTSLQNAVRVSAIMAGNLKNECINILCESVLLRLAEASVQPDSPVNPELYAARLVII